MNLLNLDHQMKSRRSPQLRRNGTLEVKRIVRGAASVSGSHQRPLGQDFQAAGVRNS